MRTVVVVGILGLAACSGRGGDRVGSEKADRNSEDIICDGVAYKSVESIDEAEDRDTWTNCWHEQTLCYRGDASDAAAVLNDLFDDLWSGDRTTDDGAVFDEGELVLSSVGEDGERTLRVGACDDASSSALRCKGTSLASVSEELDRDRWHTCWSGDGICFEGTAADAKGLLSDLFDELYSGDRTLDSMYQRWGKVYVVSTGEDGQSKLTVEPCSQ